MCEQQKISRKKFESMKKRRKERPGFNCKLISLEFKPKKTFHPSDIINPNDFSNLKNFLSLILFLTLKSI